MAKADNEKRRHRRLHRISETDPDTTSALASARLARAPSGAGERSISSGQSFRSCMAKNKRPRPRRQEGYGTLSCHVPGLDMPVYVVEGEAA